VDHPHQQNGGLSSVMAEKKLNSVSGNIRPVQDAIGAELGVIKGSFSDYFLLTKPSKLYLVDPWYSAGSEWGVGSW